MAREIEIKVSVERVQPLLELLEREGTAHGEQHQVDTYYTPAHRDYLAVRPVAEWLRLRREGERASLNHKRWIYGPDGTSHHCEETETPVGDAAAAAQLLAALDARELVTVDKLRRSWTWGDYEVAIDRVAGLGDFVELEWKGADRPGDEAEITAGMEAWLRGLGCGTLTRGFRGYPYALMFPGEGV